MRSRPALAVIVALGLLGCAAPSRLPAPELATQTPTRTDLAEARSWLSCHASHDATFRFGRDQVTIAADAAGRAKLRRVVDGWAQLSEADQPIQVLVFGFSEADEEPAIGQQRAQAVYELLLELDVCPNLPIVVHDQGSRSAFVSVVHPIDCLL